MKRWYHPTLALLLGLFTAQVLATAQVYLSNVELYRTLLPIKDAGYFLIPNEQIMPRLQAWGPALFGGLFFTLSIGVGLSLLSLAAAWIWDRLVHQNKSFLIFYLVLWMGSFVLVNYRGFSPVVSLYFLFIPTVVFSTSLRWIRRQAKRGAWVDRMIHAVPLLLLAILWTSQMDRNLFLDLRDKLLLSNPIGTKINDFYYDYTPYPTNVFESLNQKILKACNLEAIRKKPVAGALEKTLLNHDYLNVGRADRVDLEIEGVGNNLVFRNRGKTILRTTLRDFLARPGTVLEDFSATSDKHVFFRHFTFFSLLFGFPILLYIFLYTLLRLLAGLFFNSRPSSAIASILCFLVGTAFLAILSFGEGKTIEVKHLGEALYADTWQKRVQALKVVERKKMEIADFPGYQSLLESPRIPERYWLVRALGVSRRQETYQDLLTFLDDPHPNVVRMAFDSLGRRHSAKAIGEIKKRIESSDHWYNQRHAYRALRTLGWKQSKKPPHP
jgi:Ca2+/Na+ antiporter